MVVVFHCVTYLFLVNYFGRKLCRKFARMTSHTFVMSRTLMADYAVWAAFICEGSTMTEMLIYVSLDYL